MTEKSEEPKIKRTASCVPGRKYTDDLISNNDTEGMRDLLSIIIRANKELNGDARSQGSICDRLTM